MKPARLRRKLEKRRKQLARQTRLYKATGKRGHRRAMKRHARAIRKLRHLLRRATTPQPISEQGIDFIARFEGFYPRPYNDPVGYATVGYGHLIAYRPVLSSDNQGIWVKGQKRRGVLTEAEAKTLLKRKLASDYEPAVRRLFEVGGPLHGKFTQGRYDALCSFAFNLGPASLSGIPGFETMGRAIQSGDLVAISDAFLLYDKAGGRALPGLTRRRKAEQRLFVTGRYGG